jgi:hypothetical protein
MVWFGLVWFDEVVVVVALRAWSDADCGMSDLFDLV